MAKIKLYKWLSEIWGKCNRGETVFRRFRKTIVVEANPSPSYTRTDKQDKVRKAYRTALIEWRKMSDEEKEYWRERGRKLGLPAYQTYMKFRLLELLKIPFHYEITIDNSANSNDLEDYQILLVVNNDSEFFSTVQDPKYMEFYDSDKTTLLNHYVEEWDNINYNARIWIKIPLIPANATKKIYLKVNESRTEDLSDPNAVFDFYDDFEENSLDTSKWTPNYVNTVYYEVLNDELRIYDATKSSNTYWIYDNSDTGSQIKANFSPLDKMIIEWKQKMETQSSASPLGEAGLALCRGDNAIEVYNPMYDDVSSKILYQVGRYGIINGSKYGSDIVISPNTYYIMKIIKNGTNFILKVYDLEGNEIFSYSGSSSATISYLAIAVGAYGGYGFSPMRIDWVRVRKYAEPEPTVSYAKIA